MNRKFFYNQPEIIAAERAVSRIGACFIVVDPAKFEDILFLDTTRLLVYDNKEYSGKLLYQLVDGPLMKVTTKDDSNFHKVFEDRFGFILIPESANETDDLLQYYHKPII